MRHYHRFHDVGYYKNKEETDRTIDAKGWLHTGDIGYIDDDGDIFIVDRIKEMIKYKGFQVWGQLPALASNIINIEVKTLN